MHIGGVQKEVFNMNRDTFRGGRGAAGERGRGRGFGTRGRGRGDSWSRDTPTNDWGRRFREEEEEVDRCVDRKRQRREQRHQAKQARIQVHQALSRQKQHDVRRTSTPRQTSSRSDGAAARRPTKEMAPKPPKVKAAPRKEREPLASSASDAQPKATSTSTTPSGGAYVPPSARRAAAGSSAPLRANRSLTLEVRRIVNKLTLENVGPLAQQVVKLLESQCVSRSDLITVLARLMTENIANTPEVTTIVSFGFAGFIRGLQLLFGAEICRPIVEAISNAVLEAMQRASDGDDSAETENTAQGCSRILAHLYCLDGLDAQYIIDCLRDCAASYGVCGVVAALSVLRSCGKKLANQRPAELNSMLATLEHESASHDASRVNVLLSLCKDIARGHIQSGARTVKGEEEVSQEEVTKSLLPLMGTGTGANELRTLRRRLASYNVMQGSWPTASSVHADSGELPSDGDDEDDNHVDFDEEDDEEEANDDEEAEEESAEAKAAREKKAHILAVRTMDKALSGQRLATEAKRQIFHCIATGTDDMDIFQMLVNRDPSGSQILETMGVLLQCCYQDSLYNPAYASVLQRLVSSKRAYRNSLQFALWDKFKSIRLEAVDVTGFVNLSCLLSALFEADVFHLAVLRGLDLEQTSKSIGFFTRILLLRLIVGLSELRLVSLFFGGTGTAAHDLNSDTSILRKCLSQFVAKYFVDEVEAKKWIPACYEVVTAPVCQGADAAVLAGPEAPERLVKRIRTVHRALKEGLS